MGTQLRNKSLNSNYVKLVVTGGSVNLTYADSTSALGYRTTESNKILASTVANYPVGKNIIGQFVVPLTHYGDIFYIDSDGYIRGSSQISGTRWFRLFVFYTD